MAGRHGAAFMFCEVCGAMLSMKSVKYAECVLCGFKRSAKELQERMISYTISAEDIRKELKTEPFIQLEKVQVAEAAVERATVDEDCPKCRHPQLEYYTKQLRSADEGQTVFYECPKCRYKFSHNT